MARMLKADIAVGVTYHGSDDKNTRRVEGILGPLVTYTPTGNRKPQWCLRQPDGTYQMTLEAFARWAKGRVSQDT